MFGQERALKLYDIIDLSKLYEAEFNKADLHDRILIFDVVASPPTGNTAENSAEKERNAKDVVDNEASKQSKDGNDGRVTKIVTFKSFGAIDTLPFM